MADRERGGREASPSAAVRDSRSVRTADQRGARQAATPAKISGRKRHILTDADGRPRAVHVHGAGSQDRDGGKGVPKRPQARFPFVQRVRADGGDAGRLVGWAKNNTRIVLEIIPRTAAAKGFRVPPRRGVVERTFAWIVEEPPLRARLQAPHQRRRNPHRHRGPCNARQASALSEIQPSHARSRLAVGIKIDP